MRIENYSFQRIRTVRNVPYECEKHEGIGVFNSTKDRKGVLQAARERTGGYEFVYDQIVGNEVCFDNVGVELPEFRHCSAFLKRWEGLGDKHTGRAAAGCHATQKYTG